MTSHSLVVNICSMREECGEAVKGYNSFEYLDKIIGYINNHKISTKTERFVSFSGVSPVLRTA